ncbi:MAG: TatD-related deoxyribonuclease [Candidatus Parcubacteria bacterium]|nr:MAG: TatD-related deoxyribonuclease [Candidatus Parcubacteria bacterium]
MKFFDTHCHLNIPPLREIYKEIIESAQKNNIDYIVIPGTNYEDSIFAIEIANSFNNIYCALGFHPNEIIELSLKEIIIKLDKLKNNLNEDKVIAIGEIGLDKKAGNFDFQKEIFILQIRLAKKYNKPLIIHNRELSNDLLKILKQEWNDYFENNIVFHCTEPNEEILEFAKIKKLYLGFDGDLTYRKDKQEFIKKVPLDLIVMETDSPFLLPEPLRTFIKHQTRNKEENFFPNKPENLILIFNKIVEILNLDKEILAQKLLENSLRLFNLK